MLWIVACLLAVQDSPPAHFEPHPAEAAIDESGLLEHIAVLASDGFEGRAPATRGEELTVLYLIDTFQRLGLAPGNPDGSNIQKVPLVGFTTEAKGTLRVGQTTIPLDRPDAWVAVSRRQVPEIEVTDSPLVFVGYGVVAPEYEWDDYKGMDLRGKTLVMLVGDPPVPDPDDPSRLDEATFKGRAMTYYGRWTYKYEIAAEKGAAAVLLIHETDAAGYPYSVVTGSWGRENFDIPSADGQAGRAAIEAWISSATAEALLKAAGQDLAALKAAALRRDFRPVSLDATLTATARNTIRRVESRNALARLEGVDPVLSRETIVITAHWDHLGRDDSLPSDPIYNGAADNASGVALMLELAEALTRTQPRPRRSILFLAVTAEEKGLLGARFYADNPLYPLASTIANINLDVINLWGRTTDITSVGLGQTTLDDLLAELAAQRGRTLVPDPEPEKGMYYRSDHFEFARAGVPALNVKGGIQYLGKPKDYGRQVRDHYTANDYHKPSDEVKPDWDLAGAVEDGRLLHALILRLANDLKRPDWKPGSEFKAKRDRMLGRQPSSQP
ncbi:MAG: hypothetical protein KatS3mg108_1145 [Isosphaeraceae bacterium]|nr:MAG: hypothetical protein KatS3mg108_1145 [Isosphaeraceae bacterium]